MKKIQEKKPVSFAIWMNELKPFKHIYDDNKSEGGKYHTNSDKHSQGAIRSTIY